MKQEQQNNGRAGHDHIVGEPGARHDAPVPRDGGNLGDRDPQADGHHHLEQGDSGEQVDGAIDCHRPIVAAGPVSAQDGHCPSAQAARAAQRHFPRCSRHGEQ